MLSHLNRRFLNGLWNDFIALAHRHQEPPRAAVSGRPWTCWLMLGGRGAGKTRLGAEWVRALAAGAGPYAGERKPLMFWSFGKNIKTTASGSCRVQGARKLLRVEFPRQLNPCTARRKRGRSKLELER